MENSGCHQLVFRARSQNDVVKSVGLSLPDVRMITWKVLAVINWCFDCAVEINVVTGVNPTTCVWS
jgi:hypothetical protein